MNNSRQRSFNASDSTGIFEISWNLLGWKWWLVVFGLIQFMGRSPPEYAMYAWFFLFCFSGYWSVRYWVLKFESRNEEDPDFDEREQLASRFNGVFFGTEDAEPVGKRSERDGHILVVGGAGSGKSSCIAIPTLKDYWDGRFLAVDIKGELAAKSKRPALVFNPVLPDGRGYDPFYLARESDDPLPYIRDIALALVPMKPDIKDPFWVQASQNILTGHLVYSFKQGGSFVEALEVLQSVPAQHILKVDSEDDYARRYLIQYMDTKRETLASIMSELSNHIIPLVTDRDIMNVLGKKDVIKPDLLEQGDDIFLQIPEYKINQWKVLITLIIQQFLTHFERRQEGDNVPILFLLDEFARFGKLEAVIHGLATLRSKRITICILIQSLAQLDATYGPEQRKIICDNCGYKAVLSATDVDTQKYFSALVGTKMYTQQQFSETAGESKDNKSFISFVLDTLTGEHPSGSGSASVSNSQSISTSEVERAVIKPEDFAYLKNDMVLLTPEGYSRVVKCPYYAVQPFR